MTEPLSDFRMTKVTFGVSASSFATKKMHWTLPLAHDAVKYNFYVDDGLTAWCRLGTPTPQMELK